MQIHQLLKEGKDFLSGGETASLDAEVLLAYALGEDREYLISHGEEEVDQSVTPLFEEYLEQIDQGKPMAYILGEKEFYGLNFFVDERVLVPRPETEHVVEKALDFLQANDRASRRFSVLDVGTGSGCISISIAYGFSEAGGEIGRIDAVDVSEIALEVARVNVSQHGLEEMIHVYQSDLLENIEEGEEFDLIVANLPYIGEDGCNVSSDVQKYEPRAALFGGSDGLELYKKMFQQLRDKRVGFEMMIGEFGFGQRKELEELLSKYFDQEWSVEKDHAGIDRIFVIS